MPLECFVCLFFLHGIHIGMVLPKYSSHSVGLMVNRAELFYKAEGNHQSSVTVQ